MEKCSRHPWIMSEIQSRLKCRLSIYQMSLSKPFWKKLYRPFQSLSRQFSSITTCSIFCTNFGDSVTYFNNECQWLDSTDIVQNCAGSLFLLLGWRKLDMCLSQNLLISMFLNMLVAHWFYRMSSFSINRTWCVVIWKKRCEETVRKYYNHH